MTSLSTIAAAAAPPATAPQRRTAPSACATSSKTAPAQVNEVWCRKIFRQLLQSLELQYAMHMPHRAITPDTIVFHENGEPLLMPPRPRPDRAHEARTT